jgi:hypothetical protein
MEIRNIHKLLAKYWEGETSLSEEEQLRAWFAANRNDLPESLKKWAPHFIGLAELRELSPSPDFSKRLADRIENAPRRTLRLKPVGKWALTAAAGLALLLMAWYGLKNSSSPTEPQAIDWSRYEAQTPEEAFRITREALEFSAVQLKKGTDRAYSGIERFQEISKRTR